MLLATALALASALLHAAWNLFVKTSEDRDLASWGQFAAAGLLVLPALPLVGLPPDESWRFLAISGLVHVAYVSGLVAAYHHGDFSLAYPLARGGGAVLAALGGVLLLDDELRTLAWVAVAVAAAGLCSLVGRGSTAASVGWALFTAACIATYTLVDSHGARLGGDGVSYGFALMPVTGLTITAAGLARGRGPAMAATLRRQWWHYLLAGALMAAAYTLVLVAVNHAPVGHVTMLRESSVVIAALAGWLLLHEPLGHRRLASSAVVLGGLVLLVVANT
jgi:drug/metabolite transporter (DMT)-like permease